MKGVKHSLKKSHVKSASGKSPVKHAKFGEFLFEVGCEEIPAGMVEKACGDLHKILLEKLNAHRLLAESSSEKSLEVFGAPRRLVAVVKEVRLRQEDIAKE